MLGMTYHEYVKSTCSICGVSTSTVGSELNHSDKWWHQLTVSTLVCQACHDAIHWLPKPQLIGVGELDNDQLKEAFSLSVQTASTYGGVLRQAMLNFKHHDDIASMPMLIHAIRQLPRPSGCHAGNAIILPMPTTIKRIGNRGFDPVTILSRYLSKHWRLPLWHGVSRVDDGISQQGLGRQERRDNIKGAFALTNPLPDKPYRHIILFDDVVTTGSTLKELALSLLNSTQFPYNTFNLSAYAILGGKRP